MDPNELVQTERVSSVYW